MKETSMKDFFKEAFGLKLEEMKTNKPYLVEEAGVEIESLDKEGNIVFSKVLRAVKKSKRTMYSLCFDNGRSVRVSNDHKFAIQDGNNLNWYLTEDIYKARKNRDFTFIGEDIPTTLISIKKDGKDWPLDIEVDNTNCYFSNGVLSHNSMYGPDYKAAFSGQSTDFYASWMARLTRTEDIKEKDDTVGIMIKVRNEKSKLSNPKRVAIIKLLFNGGIDSEDEYLDYLKTLGIIEQRGSYFSNEEWGMKVQGKNGVAEFLHSNPELYEKVKQQVNDMICGHTTLDNQETTEEEVWAEYENFNPETGEIGEYSPSSDV